MCHHHFAKASEADKEVKFYKHLRIYLTIIGISILARFLGTGHVGFPSFAFWWGIGVVVHYLSVFGLEGFSNNPYWTSQCGTTKDQYRDEEEPVEPEPLVDERVPRRIWRDRDLV